MRTGEMETTRSGLEPASTLTIFTSISFPSASKTQTDQPEVPILMSHCLRHTWRTTSLVQIARYDGRFPSRKLSANN